jgi:uncharacterized protein with HEPN domain
MKDDRVYLVHMLEAARKVMARTTGLDRTRYDADENLRFALTHLLQVIGEAARRVGDTVRQQLALVPWRQITGMRHRIVHDYLSIDFGVVWDTATLSVPALIPQLEAALAELGDPRGEPD